MYTMKCVLFNNTHRLQKHFAPNYTSLVISFFPTNFLKYPHITNNLSCLPLSFSVMFKDYCMLLYVSIVSSLPRCQIYLLQLLFCARTIWLYHKLFSYLPVTCLFGSLPGLLCMNTHIQVVGNLMVLIPVALK